MESKVKLFGHPIHPMLIVLPLGLLSAAVIFDVVPLVTGDDVFSSVAFWNIAAGVVGGSSWSSRRCSGWWLSRPSACWSSIPTCRRGCPI